MPKYLESLGVTHFSNIKEALEWCDIANVLRIQLERQDVNYFPSLREYRMIFGINKELLDSLSKEIIIMHPGPINRGVELTSDRLAQQEVVLALATVFLDILFF